MTLYGKHEDIIFHNKERDSIGEIRNNVTWKKHKQKAVAKQSICLNNQNLAQHMGKEVINIAMLYKSSSCNSPMSHTPFCQQDKVQRKGMELTKTLPFHKQWHLIFYLLFDIFVKFLSLTKLPLFQ